MKITSCDSSNNNKNNTDDDSDESSAWSALAGESSGSNYYRHESSLFGKDYSTIICNLLVFSEPATIVPREYTPR
jgi:hypothetical protein